MERKEARAEECGVVSDVLLETINTFLFRIFDLFFGVRVLLVARIHKRSHVHHSLVAFIIAELYCNVRRGSFLLLS